MRVWERILCLWKSCPLNYFLMLVVEVSFAAYGGGTIHDQKNTAFLLSLLFYFYFWELRGNNHKIWLWRFMFLVNFFLKINESSDYGPGGDSCLAQMEIFLYNSILFGLFLSSIIVLWKIISDHVIYVFFLHFWILSQESKKQRGKIYYIIYLHILFIFFGF